MSSKVYFVSIHTANTSNAGTDCHVNIKLNGKGDWVHLNNGDDNFQKNDYDTFAVPVEDVGDITSISLQLGTQAVAAPGWECDFVVVSSFDYKTAKFNVKHKFKKGEEQVYYPMS